MKQPCSFCGYPTASRSGICKSNPECRRQLARWRYAQDPERHRAYCRSHYAANRDAMQARSRAWHAANPERSKALSQAHHAKRAEWLRDQKVGKSCVDCDIICTVDNYIAFDWDHRPGAEKSFEISQAFRKSRTSEQILTEIAKCDLRCRNCHAIITHKRRQVA